MAQINLLKHNPNPENTLRVAASIAVKLLAVALIALAGYYGYLWYQIKDQDKQAATLQEAINKEKSQTAETKEIKELRLRQNQLTEVEKIIAKHIYWSTFLPTLADAALRSSSYTTLHLLSDGTMSVSLTVPTMREMDKLLQLFNNPEINENFQNVRIGGLEIERTENGSSVRSELLFDYNPRLLEYDKQYDEQN